jgi:uncharacterized RDD family membrane protein YckC
VIEKLQFVGFWPRVGVALLDLVILLPLYGVGLLIEDVAKSMNFIWPYGWSALSIWLVHTHGGTPGKLILGMRVVEGHGNYLGVPAAIRREALGIIAITLSLIAGPIVSPWERGASIVAVINFWFSFVPLVDVLIVSLNQRRRALHDFLAGSYVVTKASLDAARLAETIPPPPTLPQPVGA